MKLRGLWTDLKDMPAHSISASLSLEVTTTLTRKSIRINPSSKRCPLMWHFGLFIQAKMLLYPANSDTACENLFSPCRVNKCDFHNFQLLVVFTMSVEVKKKSFFGRKHLWLYDQDYINIVRTSFNRQQVHFIRSWCSKNWALSLIIKQPRYFDTDSFTKE